MPAGRGISTSPPSAPSSRSASRRRRDSPGRAAGGSARRTSGSSSTQAATRVGPPSRRLWPRALRILRCSRVAPEDQGFGAVVRRCSAARTRRGPAQAGVDPDQHPVQTLPPDGSYPALGERVRPRRPHRCGDDPEPRRSLVMEPMSGSLRMTLRSPTSAEAVFTAARLHGLNRTNHDESRERRGPGVGWGGRRWPGRAGSCRSRCH